jgi:tRNA pseudouridine38-40 synthase
MPRYRLLIEYDGTPFVGWQIQAVGVTVQGLLRQAVHTLTGEWTEVRGAGRTDAGVHAFGQVAHFDCAKTYPDYVIREALNAHLRPNPISVVEAALVPDTFDARFSATARHYRYRISNRRGQPALDKHRVWWVARPLDVAAMIAAASVLEGLHDFTTFRSSSCQAKSPVKTLDRLVVRLSDDAEIQIEASARSFMHNQVRSIVGSLKRVGDGAWLRADLQAALEAKDRARCGPVAPACGLYFMRVDYAAIAPETAPPS